MHPLNKGPFSIYQFRPQRTCCQDLKSALSISTDVLDVRCHRPEASALDGPAALLLLAVGLVYYVYARPVFYSRSLVKIDAIERQVSAEKEFGEADRTGSSSASSPRRTSWKGPQRSWGSSPIIERSRKITSKRSRRSTTRSAISNWKSGLTRWIGQSVWGETMVAEDPDYRRERRAARQRTAGELSSRSRGAIAAALENTGSKLTRSRSELDTERTLSSLKNSKTLHADLVMI